MSIIALPCNIHCSDNKNSLPLISILYLVLGLLLGSCSTMNGEKRGNEWVEVRPPQYPGPTQLVLEWSNCSMEATQGKQQGVGRWLSHNPDGQTEVWSRAPRKQGQGARMNEHSWNSHIHWHRKGKHLNVMLIVKFTSANYGNNYPNRIHLSLKTHPMSKSWFKGIEPQFFPINQISYFG